MIARDHRILVAVAALVLIMAPIAYGLASLQSEATALEPCDVYFTISRAGGAVVGLFMLSIVTLLWIWWKPKR